MQIAFKGGVATGGYQADVFGDGSVGGTSPLAVDDFVEVVGVTDIGSLQDPFPYARQPCSRRTVSTHW